MSLTLFPPFLQTIDDVLSVATFVKANGATSPASALYPLYAKKEKNKFLIFVTDEGTLLRGSLFICLFIIIC